jgi:hypothetical protein
MEAGQLSWNGTKYIWRKSMKGLEMAMTDGTIRPSNATAIRLLGGALEELEKQVLYKMGGQIGGIREAAEIAVHTNAGMISGYVWLDFDANVLRKYLDQKAE